MKRHLIASCIRTVIFILTLLVILHCKKDEPGNTKINIYLTDAPAYYKAVIIDIQKITIRYDGSSTEHEVLLKSPGAHNLLEYSNGADTLLGSITLPGGKINQIRIVFGKNNIFINDSENVVLNISPGNNNSAIIKANQNIEAGKVNNIWIDIDASRSVNVEGPGVYYFAPVARIFSDQNTGAIRGLVIPQDLKPFVYAISDSATIGTITNNEGYFMIKGLPIGIYSLRFVPQKPGINEAIFDNVVVKQDSITFIGTIVIN